MRVALLLALAFSWVLMNSVQARADDLSGTAAWETSKGNRAPTAALNAGLDAHGAPIYLCRATFEGGWQLGRFVERKCVHHGVNRDVIHFNFEVLLATATSRWVSVRGGKRHKDGIRLGLGKKPTYLCRRRSAGRTSLGVQSKKGCRLLNGSLARGYELLVDPEARAQGGLTRAKHIVDQAVDLIRTGLAAVGQPRQLRAEGRRTHQAALTKLLARIPAILRKVHQQVPARFRRQMRRYVELHLDPLLLKVRRTRRLLERAIELGTIHDRCSSLAKEIRDTVRLFTSNSTAGRALPARRRIAILETLQTRLNEELRNANQEGDAELIATVTRLFAELPGLMSDAVYHTQPWLEPEERVRVFQSYLGGLSIQKPSSASKGLSRLLQLFHASDRNHPVARAVDLWLRLMDEVGTSLEQRALPDLPSMGSDNYSSTKARKLAANLRRNGFEWRETPEEPDELGGGSSTRLLIRPSLEWITRSLSQRVPAEVIARVRCLRLYEPGRHFFWKQLRACGAALSATPSGSLRNALSAEVEGLMIVNARTLNQRDCASILKRIRGNMLEPAFRGHCTNLERRKEERLKWRKAEAKVQALIKAGRLRPAAAALRRLAKNFPHEAEVHRLRYRLKRARQKKAKRLSTMAYATRLQQLESVLPELEAVCVSSSRQYRRARKRMRLAIREGQDGRAARLRLAHDGAFYRACTARGKVLELLSWQEGAGLSQATRVTRETARTCLERWSLCDRQL